MLVRNGRGAELPLDLIERAHPGARIDAGKAETRPGLDSEFAFSLRCHSRRALEDRHTLVDRHTLAA